jgi:hypothetical protein
MEAIVNEKVSVDLFIQNRFARKLSKIKSVKVMIAKNDIPKDANGCQANLDVTE